MSVSLTVKALIVDLRNDTPRGNDQFHVDTNVWFWYSYPRASTDARQYQTREYPNYISQSIKNGATLYCCGLSAGELAHTIERTECRVFGQQIGVSLNLKPFRNDYPSERSTVVQEINSAWAQVRRVATDLPMRVDRELTTNALARLRHDLLDGYDALVVEHLQRSGITNVITDDRDFATVAGITVFTANLTIVQAARDQGRLTSR